jgi:hypothetical protein
MLFTAFVYWKLLTVTMAQVKLHSIEGALIFIIYVNFVRPLL